MSGFSFKVTATDGAARSGLIETSHGSVRTPAFMPVGTKATVKTATPDELRELGAGIILGNAYHLHLRPGTGLIEKAGGLHSFMGWDGPMLTDSGGYQIFSLSHAFRLEEEGVRFRSVYDGSEHFWTPADCIRVQEAIGADIAMVLDECPPAGASREYLLDSLERTARWAGQCRDAQSRPDQLLFGIVQGGVHLDLRRRSLELTTAIGFDGYAVGGLSVGEPKEETFAVLSELGPELPADSPRYFMGIGDPEGLVRAIDCGIDMADCVLPTRIARNGAFFTDAGRGNIKNAQHTEAQGPLEDGCDCYACRRFSRAYLRHLFLSRELLVYRLITLHNLRYLVRLTERARAAIESGRFGGFRDGFLSGYADDGERPGAL